MSSKQPNQGFTLIEVMITVAIVGILAAIAYPSYMQYILTSNRSQATVELTEIANLQEQYYLDHNQYADDLSLLGYPSASIETQGGSYKVKLSNTDRLIDFTVTATPINRQAGDSHCASFTLNHQQIKGATHDDCWQ
ncbi:type IV pilin protein [Motilimonas sp. E26]|uniref:type IV pilin protein n=1 Tax=Motilimonas TaxID=1914248 RepID=UPI00249F4FFC|nr:type IV pilin protein [Motilimonas sp. E26]